MAFPKFHLEYFFQSKLLAFTSLLMFICCLACVSSALMPSWLILEITDQYEMQTVKNHVNFGIFFMDESRFINMLTLDKAGRNTVVPPLITVAQVLYLIGVTGMIVCTATCFILAFRRFSSPPGEMCLAGSSSPIAMCLVGAVVCIVLDVFVMPNEPWNWMPIPDVDPNRAGLYRRVEKVYPVMSFNYGFFVACIAALLALGSTVLMWFQAFMTCSYTRRRRYQMLRQDNDTEPRTKPGNPAYPVFSNVGYTRTTPGEVDL